jgi:hypothetical protein
MLHITLGANAMEHGDTGVIYSRAGTLLEAFAAGERRTKPPVKLQQDYYYPAHYGIITRSFECHRTTKATILGMVTWLLSHSSRLSARTST